MTKHFQAIHPDVPDPQNHYTTEILANHRTVLRRLIDESLRIEKDKNLANSKGEWGRGGGLVRLHSKRTIDAN